MILTVRKALITAIVVAVSAYTLGVVLGYVPPERKIDTANLAIIALAVLCVFLLANPAVLQRLKAFEVSGVKFEMLERVKEKQAEQEHKIEDIALILPLLLPKAERKHLLNLANGKTAYKGNAALRAELRRLRTATLIRSLPEFHIGQVEDNANIDLAKYVALTPLGERLVRRIRELEQVETQEEKKPTSAPERPPGADLL
jgi:hypothetical protein